ncbi:MAG TPA: hypothetical protein VD905_11470 [Flavobacteriales bacterium]|nr:hypothetical protein [Flavobacteriales bacterium]
MNNKQQTKQQDSGRIDDSVWNTQHNAQKITFRSAPNHAYPYQPTTNN